MGSIGFDLGSSWGCSGDRFVSFRGRSGDRFGVDGIVSSRGRFGVDLASIRGVWIWVDSGSIRGCWSTWGRFWRDLGSTRGLIRGRFGSFWGRSRAEFGVDLGSTRAHQLALRRVGHLCSTHAAAIRIARSGLSGWSTPANTMWRVLHGLPMLRRWALASLTFYEEVVAGASFKSSLSIWAWLLCRIMQG